MAMITYYANNCNIYRKNNGILYKDNKTFTDLIANKSIIKPQDDEDYGPLYAITDVYHIILNDILNYIKLDIHTILVSAHTNQHREIFLNIIYYEREYDIHLEANHIKISHSFEYYKTLLHEKKELGIPYTFDQYERIIPYDNYTLQTLLDLLI